MENTNIAAIDIGTNTFHFIIANTNGVSLRVIHKENHPVKLGEDLLKNNMLVNSAIERAVVCLKYFSKMLAQFEVKEYFASATSAVRTAQNGDQFVALIKKETNIDIQVIGGETEAQLIYEGVRSSGAIIGKSLLMDMGGGSTEFVCCNENQIFWKKSFETGASKLMQRFFKSDPISITDQQAIVKHFDVVLAPLLDFMNDFEVDTLVGSAGAFETFAALTNVDFINVPSAIISVSDYQKLSKLLIASTHEQRKLMPNLIPLRTDMIVMACLLTDYVIKKFKIQKIVLSTYDLKMGVLYRLMQGNRIY